MSRNCPACGNELMRVDDLMEMRAPEIFAKYKSQLGGEGAERLPEFWGCTHCLLGELRLILPNEFMPAGELGEMIEYLKWFKNRLKSERAGTRENRAGYELLEHIAKTIEQNGSIDESTAGPAVKITLMRQALEEYQRGTKPREEILKEVRGFIERYRDQLIIRGFPDPAIPLQEH